MIWCCTLVNSGRYPCTQHGTKQECLMVISATILGEGGNGDAKMACAIGTPSVAGDSSDLLTYCSGQTPRLLLIRQLTRPQASTQS